MAFPELQRVHSYSSELRGRDTMFISREVVIEDSGFADYWPKHRRQSRN